MEQLLPASRLTGVCRSRSAGRRLALHLDQDLESRVRDSVSASAKVKAANDVTCSGRGVPFRRRESSATSPVTQHQEVKMRLGLGL